MVNLSKFADMIKHGQSGDADSDWLKIKTVSFFEVPLFTEKKENRYVNLDVDTGLL